MKRDKEENHKQTDSSENDSSSSEDDENAELLTEELEEGFFKVLSQLKKKDLKLYEESVKYFPSEKDGSLNLKLEKTNKESQEEYREWLKGQKEKVDDEVKKDLKALHDFWTCPTLNKDEQFLRDYILNKKFLEPDESFNIEEEINKLSDEEKEVEEQLLFEHKYNRRFETSEEEPVIKKESKSKRKNNKGNNEVFIHNNKNICTHNDISTSSEQVESSVVETNTVSKKKKKKRNKRLENNETEESEEITKVENTIKKEDEQETLPEDVNTGNHEDVSQGNSIGKSKRRKSRKRKRNSVQNEETPTLNISSNVNTSHSGIVPPKKKSKKKRNFQNVENSGTNNLKENVLTLSQEKKKQPNNIPRNLQMKNKNGVKKLRYRNMKKGRWSQINSGDVQKQKTGVEQQKHTVGVNKSTFDKKTIHPNDLNKKSAKKRNKFHPKKITHFQNLIVKEKKNKELKFGKVLSKKQKAASAARKS